MKPGPDKLLTTWTYKSEFSPEISLRVMFNEHDQDTDRLAGFTVDLADLAIKEWNSDVNALREAVFARLDLKFPPPGEPYLVIMVNGNDTKHDLTDPACNTDSASISIAVRTTKVTTLPDGRRCFRWWNEWQEISEHNLLVPDEPKHRRALGLIISHIRNLKTKVDAGFSSNDENTLSQVLTGVIIGDKERKAEGEEG